MPLQQHRQAVLIQTHLHTRRQPKAALSDLQATIYDDMHMGDHVAVVGNLSLSNSLEASKVGTCSMLASATTGPPCFLQLKEYC